MVGTSGSGKTYVALALAKRLGLAYISNDAIILGPNWQAVPKDEVYRRLDEATSVDGWTFDGNLTLSRPEDRLVLERCDTLVWLDLPRWQTHWQVLRRTLARAVTREALWHGNRESWRTMFSPNSIVWWSIKTYNRRRREYGRLYSDPELARLTRIQLRSRRDIERWLASVAC